MRAAPGILRLSRRLEGIALLLIAVSAILFQRAATSSWAETRAANGHRLVISPIGIRDWGTENSIVVAECRWWPKLGDAQLCALAADGEMAMRGLRRVYPLTVVSLWTSVLALFLVALKIPRIPRALGVVVTGVIPVLATIAMYSLVTSAPRALSVLASANFSVEPGMLAGVLGGALLTTVSVILLLKSGPTQPADETRLDVAVPLRDELRTRSR